MNRRSIFCGMAGLLCFACLGIAICTMENIVADAQEAVTVPTLDRAPTVTIDLLTTADPFESRGNILAALDRNGEWEFSEAPLEDVVAFVGSSSQIDVLLDIRALEDEGVSSDTPITCNLKDISLRSFFGIVLGELELTHEIHDGALWITTPEAAESRLSVHTYPVSDLFCDGEDSGEAAYDYDSLLELIMSLLQPDSWDQVGGPGAIDMIYGTLVVSHVSDVHEQLAQFLTTFRQLVRQYEENPGGPGLPLIVGDSAARTKIMAALESRMTLELKDAPLSDVIELLAKSAGIPIIIEGRALDEFGIAFDVPVTARVNQLPLRFVLQRLLDPHGLTWTIRNEVLSITTYEVSEEQLLTCIYPVNDLVAPHADAQPEEYDFDSLIEVITRIIEPDTWDDVGGPGAIASIVNPPAIVISQSESVHRQVRELLHQLRRAKQIERAAQKLSAQGVSRLSVRSYTMQLGHDAHEVLEMVTRLLGNDILEGEGIVIDVLGNEIVVRHDFRGHRRIESMLSQMGVWQPPQWGAGKGGGGGFGGGGGGGFGGGGGGGFGGGDGGFGGGGGFGVGGGANQGGKPATPNNGGGGFF